jgi:hypothetical protein
MIDEQWAFAENAPLETRGKLGKPFAQTALGKGVYTPLKVDGYQNKGVVGGAFRKRMKTKRMDGKNLGLARMGVPQIRPGCESGILARMSFGIHGGRIAGKCPSCQLPNWYRSNKLWKITGRKSRQVRFKTRTLENPQGMRHPDRAGAGPNSS